MHFRILIESNEKNLFAETRTCSRNFLRLNHTQTWTTPLWSMLEGAIAREYYATRFSHRNFYFFLTKLLREYFPPMNTIRETICRSTIYEKYHCKFVSCVTSQDLIIILYEHRSMMSRKADLSFNLKNTIIFLVSYLINYLFEIIIDYLQSTFCIIHFE